METKSLTYQAPETHLYVLRSYSPVAQSGLQDLTGSNPVDADDFDID